MKKSEYTEFVLQNYEDSRSDDVKLIYYHLRRMGLYIPLDTLRKLKKISQETVSLYDLVRYRQKFQADGKYWGTPEVMEERRRRASSRLEKEKLELTHVVEEVEEKKIVYEEIKDQEGRTVSYRQSSG